MPIFAETLGGEKFTLAIDDIDLVDTLVTNNDFTELSGHTLIISDTLALPDRVFTSLPAGDVPVIPVPTSATSLPPDTSETVRVAAATLEEPFIKLAGNWKSIPALRKKGWRFDPEFPDVSLAYERFWLNNGSFVIRGPQKWERSVTTKEGMSKKEGSEFAAELGVGDWTKKLPLKLSAKFNRSFTVSEEVSIQEKQTLDVAEGRIAVYSLWQLINDVVVEDDSNDEFEWEGWAIPPFSPLMNIRYKVKWRTSRARQATPTYAFDPHFFDV